jgi:flagellar biosynthesis protein FlhA
MSDITAAPTTGVSGINLPGLGDIGAFFKRGDLALAIGVLHHPGGADPASAAVAVDLALAISIIISVLILMTALFIQPPLEFCVVSTVLLIATMLGWRSTSLQRGLILRTAMEGTDAAGHVIEAFGNFVMSGNFVIGIMCSRSPGDRELCGSYHQGLRPHRGSGCPLPPGRYAPASKWQSMPILSAGLIDEKEARRRRQVLEDEGGFFGAMDGASKFVRGDAIAPACWSFSSTSSAA